MARRARRSRHREVVDLSNTVTDAPVKTGLYIGGEVRDTAETLAIADPGKPGVIVGHAASASQEDVADAVAAAKAAFPAWAALTPQQRAAKMAEAIAGIADDRDEDAAILSQENGKVRFEGWVDCAGLRDPVEPRADARRRGRHRARRCP